MTQAVFFLVSITTVDTTVNEHWSEETKESVGKMTVVFEQLKWGHLAMVLSQILSLYLKAKNRPNMGQIVISLALCFCYLLPIIRALFILKIEIQSHYTEESFADQVGDVVIWVVIEVWYFFYWLLSLSIFCLLAYIFKFRTLFKMDAEPEHLYAYPTDEIWNNKQSDDFLKYFKWEAFAFGIVGTQLMMTMQVLFIYGIIATESVANETVHIMLYILMAQRLHKFNYILFIFKKQTQAASKWRKRIRRIS